LKPAAVKPKLATLILLGSLLFVLTGSCLCSSGSKQYADMMTMVPVASTEFHFWNIHGLGADSELWPLYEKFRESSIARQLADIEPVLAVVKNSAKASGFDGSVTVLEGDFNSRDLERRLKSEGYVLSMHLDVEIWTPEEGELYVSVALVDRAVLMGTAEDLKACINAMELDQQDSFYEDQAIEWVADRLPEGLIVDIFRAGPDSTEHYADLISYGRSYTKEGEDKLRMTGIYMFSDGYAAEPALAHVSDYLKGQEFTNVETKQEGNFIRATASVYISDLTRDMPY